MSESVKIVSLELENVKRVQAVTLEPSATGLTVIGGGNRQGKTSILDAIAFALGGERRRPTNLQRDGGMADARIEVTLSNGLKVERKGKNAALKVTDPTGTKGGQKLLDSFIEELALDLPKFLQMKPAEKAGVLLNTLGIGPQLEALDKEERKVYEERTIQGRIADQKEKLFRELPWHPDVPEVPVTAAELVQESQAILSRNAERATMRANAAKVSAEFERLTDKLAVAHNRVDSLEKQLLQARNDADEIQTRCAEWAEKSRMARETDIPADESTAAIESKMNEIEAINAKVRDNLNKAKAKDDAEHAADEVRKITVKVNEVRDRRRALLSSVNMPLPGLAVENGELLYLGKAWDCMSGVERVRAGAAIVRTLKPECGFILLDQLEQFDLAELDALAKWLESEGLQAIATRVSTGDECSIIIEDGLVAKVNDKPAETIKEQEW